MASKTTQTRENLADKVQKMSETELLDSLNNSIPMLRAFALRETAHRAGQNERFWQFFKKAVQESRNRSTLIHGFVSVSFFGLAEAAQADSARAKEVVQSVLESWSETERNDFCSWAKFEYAPSRQLETV